MTSSFRSCAPPVAYDAAMAFLASRVNHERSVSCAYGDQAFKLDRMRLLLDRLGNPQNELRIVHVAGTKGKGSTAGMIAAVLSAAGYRTGVFSSPHLERVEERIALDGRPVSSQEFVELLEQVKKAVTAMDSQASDGGAESGATYFEITTAMALLHFAQQCVDAAVLEVGLGGRLDSTNVCTPCVSVITSISLDHTQQLGGTVEAIAREKAGIIKLGVPVVSGATDPAAAEVVRQVCRERGCLLTELGTDFQVVYHPARRLESAPAVARIDYRSRGRAASDPVEYRGLGLGMMGGHQAVNAAVALASLEILQGAGLPVAESAVRAGLAGFSCPARIEVVARRPVVLLDAGHNVASIEALVRVIDESFDVGQAGNDLAAAGQCHLIFGTTQEKDVRGMLDRLLLKFDQVYLTQYQNNARAVPAQQLAQIARELTGRVYSFYPRPGDAWDAVRRSASPADLICVTGSFYLAAQMRQELRLRPIGCD